MTMWMAVALIVALVAAWAVFSPLFLSGGVTIKNAGDVEDPTYQDRKERSLRSLKDLELDFAMGRLSASDYEEARAVLAFEATEILNRQPK